MKLFTRRRRPHLLDTPTLYTAAPGRRMPDPMSLTYGGIDLTNPSIASVARPFDIQAWERPPTMSTVCLCGCGGTKSGCINIETDPHWSDLFEEVHHAVTYKPGYRLLLKPDTTEIRGRWYYQVESDRTDAVTGEPGTGKGGKAYLSPHATRSELAQTAFGLFKAYEEHEAREWFRYDGRQVYGPHFDVTALHSIAHMVEVRS